MKRTKQEYLNLLEETVEFYETDVTKRAYLGGACAYYDEHTGNMCAVGRCLKDAKYCEIEINKTHSDQYVRTLTEILGNNIFKDEYKDYNLEFWGELQNLHDSDRYWTEFGLSDSGKRYIKYIVQKIEKGVYI